MTRNKREKRISSAEEKEWRREAERAKGQKGMFQVEK